LTAERHRTDLIARQTGECLPAKQQAVLTKRAVGKGEAILQREDSLEAADPVSFWFDIYVSPVSMRPYNVTLL
jgi:hypothetical protein